MEVFQRSFLIILRFLVNLKNLAEKQGILNMELILLNLGPSLGAGRLRADMDDGLAPALGTLLLVGEAATANWFGDMLVIALDLALAWTLGHLDMLEGAEQRIELGHVESARCPLLVWSQEVDLLSRL